MIQLNKILKSFKKTIDQLEQLTATNNKASDLPKSVLGSAPASLSSPSPACTN